MLRVIDSFLANNQNPEAVEILQSFHTQEDAFVKELTNLFEQEGAAVPIGFTENDVNVNAPKLFDDIYEVMYLRTMMKVASGLHAIHMSMAYRKDIMELYKLFLALAKDLLEKSRKL